MDPIIYCLQEINFTYNDTGKLRVQEEKINMLMLIKEIRSAVLISNKTYLRAKKIRRDREGHYKMIEMSIFQEDLVIIHIYIYKRVTNI